MGCFSGLCEHAKQELNVMVSPLSSEAKASHGCRSDSLYCVLSPRFERTGTMSAPVPVHALPQGEGGLLPAPCKGWATPLTRRMVEIQNMVLAYQWSVFRYFGFSFTVLLLFTNYHFTSFPRWWRLWWLCAPHKMRACCPAEGKKGKILKVHSEHFHFQLCSACWSPMSTLAPWRHFRCWKCCLARLVDLQVSFHGFSG